LTTFPAKQLAQINAAAEYLTILLAIRASASRFLHSVGKKDGLK
jgi:hypothetical protein